MTLQTLVSNPLSCASVKNPSFNAAELPIFIFLGGRGVQIMLLYV